MRSGAAVSTPLVESTLSAAVERRRDASSVGDADADGAWLIESTRPKRSKSASS